MLRADVGTIETWQIPTYGETFFQTKFMYGFAAVCLVEGLCRNFRTQILEVIIQVGDVFLLGISFGADANPSMNVETRFNNG